MIRLVVVMALVGCGGAAPEGEVLSNSAGPGVEDEAASCHEPGAKVRTVVAQFSDASGLPLGTMVVHKDAPIGAVADIELSEGNRAVRLTIEFNRPVEIFSNGELRRSGIELLGASELELNPGHCPDSDSTAVVERLAEGAEIAAVEDVQPIIPIR